MSQHEKDQRDREERLQNQVNNLRSQLKGQEYDRRERAERLEHIKHGEDRRWRPGTSPRERGRGERPHRSRAEAQERTGGAGWDKGFDSRELVEGERDERRHDQWGDG